MRISLTVTAGPHEGQVYHFEGHDTFIVGRSKRSHFRLPHKDKYFSRVHFMVEVNPPQCRLMDMGSTNGTYVNSQKVKMVDLKDGDEIRAGKTVLRVSFDHAEGHRPATEGMGALAAEPPELPRWDPEGPVERSPFGQPEPLERSPFGQPEPVERSPFGQPEPVPDLPPFGQPEPLFPPPPLPVAQPVGPPDLPVAEPEPLFPVASPPPEPAVPPPELSPIAPLVKTNLPPEPAPPLSRTLSPQTPASTPGEFVLPSLRPAEPPPLVPSPSLPPQDEAEAEPLSDLSPPPGPPLPLRREVAEAPRKSQDPARFSSPPSQTMRETTAPEPAEPSLLRPVATPTAPPLPLPRLTPVPREPCLVCNTPVVVTAFPSPNLASGSAPTVCPACWESIRNQHQPITGFQILKKIGHGGMGVVQLAVRLSDNALVALKTIIPSVAGSPTKVERFLREAGILRDLNHPHIVSFKDMGESNGLLYFAMDYVPGTDLHQLLKQNGGPLVVSRGVTLICQLLDALDYAHGRGFVHRDIKPANLLVTRVNGKETLKLADFGLARVYQASELSGLTMTGDMGGTLAFMAPEQITKFREAKPPADIYAAAATLYNLLTDRFIHDLPKAAEQRLMMIMLEDAHPIRSRRPEIAEGLAQVIHRALEKDPEDRFTNAKSMRAALLPFAK